MNKLLNLKEVQSICTLLSKIPLIMRISLVLLFVFAFQINAKHVYSQSEKISLDIKNSSIEKVLQSIEEKSDYYFLYSNRFIDVDRTVSVTVESEAISSVLDRLFSSDEVDYEVKGSQIVLSPREKDNVAGGELLKKQQQDGKTIRGTITDAEGESIIGANIIEKGTSNGTITDFDGNFTLSVANNAILRISYIGYLDQEVAVQGQNTFNLILLEDTKTLDEVVVIGYGDTRKKDLSMAVGTVDFGKELKSRASGFEGMLQGQIAGVTISNIGGDPLSKPSITIRGQGSRSGDEVLYIVDGVPGAPFNSEDVESISVLKDAASAAIYGAHVGSGGVIVVTTKKAQSGKTQISANVTMGVSKASNLPKMTNAAEYSDIMKAAGNTGGHIDPSQYVYARTTNTDWMDEIFRTGTYKRASASISGGSENTRSLASVSFEERDGILLNTHSKNLGAKVNVEYDINKYITFSERVSYNYSNGQGNLNTYSHTGVIAQAMQMPASAPIREYTKDGKPVYGTDGNHAYGGTVPRWAEGYAGNFGEVQNPVATLERLSQNRPAHHLMSTSSLTIKPIRSLTIKSDFSAGFNTDRFEEFTKKIPEIGNPRNENLKEVSSSLSNTWLWETVATYSTEIDNKHLISLMGGYTMGYDKYSSNMTTVYDFSREDDWAQMFVNGNDFSKTKPSEVFWEESKISGFGRGSYSYDDRYFFTGSLRYDATSRLSKDNRSQVFPAVSAAWKLSSEPFFESLGENISLLKLRGSWGRIGNVSSVGYYASNIKFSENEDFTYFGSDLNTGVKGLSLNTFLNPNLRWETTEQIDIGFDLNLFNDRFTFIMDWFRKDTRDLIEDLIVTPTAGIQEAPKGNVGKVRNSGFEFAATYADKIGSVNYNVGANFATLKNEVLNLGDVEYLAHTHTLRAFQPLRSAVGQPWYSYFLIPTDGLFRTQEEVDTYNKENKDALKNAKPGDIRFIDVDGNGIINENDRQFMDSYAPKYTYAFNAGASWNNFDFSFQFQGVGGNKIFNGTKVMTYATETGWNLSKDLLDSFTFNKDSDVPRLDVDDSNGNYTTMSDFFLESGSYLRLKNLTVGYTLPKNILSKLGGDTTLRVYASGENLFTITHYSGMDPEVGRMGLDGGRYPLSRVINVGLNLNF